jgi:hypothetical protein
MWKVPGRSRQSVPRTSGSKPRPAGTGSQPGAQTCSRCPPLRRASLHVRASVRTFPNGPTMPCLALRALCGAHCAGSSGATEPRLQGKARKCRSALSGSRSKSDHAAVLINVTLHAVDAGQGQTYVSRMSRRHNSTWLSMLRQRHRITSMRTPRRSGASASCGRQAWGVRVSSKHPCEMVDAQCSIARTAGRHQGYDCARCAEPSLSQLTAGQRRRFARHAMHSKPGAHCGDLPGPL